MRKVNSQPRVPVHTLVDRLQSGSQPVYLTLVKTLEDSEAQGKDSDNPRDAVFQDPSWASVARVVETEHSKEYPFPTALDDLLTFRVKL